MLIIIYSSNILLLLVFFIGVFMFAWIIVVQAMACGPIY